MRNEESVMLKKLKTWLRKRKTERLVRAVVPKHWGSLVIERLVNGVWSCVETGRLAGRLPTDVR